MNNIILDTDPGIDDAIAMILLLAHAPEQVKCVLSSYGNISAEKTTVNALKMLELCGCDIPVVKGARMPDNDKYVEAAHIHGADGLGGLNIGSLKTKAVEGDFLKIVYNIIIENDKVDYITIGPLTNLALLIKRFPDVVDHIGKVVTMGGGIEFGNVTKHAEFNIHCDAQSADFVFKNITDLTLVPLDTTTCVAFTLPQIEEIEKIGSNMSTAAAKILTSNYHNCVGYGENGSTMHDASAVMYYLNPSIFETERCGIDVDCSDEYYGKTIVTNDRYNITLTKKVDSAIVLKEITESIKQFK